MKTVRIMFVCHGNICRSPMAECILRDMVAKEGRMDEFFIRSSATSSEEIWNGVGNPIYPPAAAELRSHGIPVLVREAVQLKKADYGEYDLFVGMDSANIRNMHRIFGADPDNKIRKLMSFAGTSKDVADPWYTGDFSLTYQDILEGCIGLLNQVKKSV